MKQLLFFIALIISINVNAQSGYFISKNDCLIEIKKSSDSTLIVSLNADLMTWYKPTSNSFQVQDGIKSWSSPLYYINNYSDFDTLFSYFMTWKNECRNSSGDVNIDLTPLINANQDNADSLFALSQCDRGFDNRIGKYSGSSVTFPANTYNGISIIQLAGTIDVIGIDVLSGIIDTTSYSSYSFSYYEQCHKLENAITIDATNGAISVTTLQ